MIIRLTNCRLPTYIISIHVSLTINSRTGSQLSTLNPKLSTLNSSEDYQIESKKSR